MTDDEREEIREEIEALNRQRAAYDQWFFATAARLALVNLAWWLWTVAITVLEGP